MNVEQLLTHDDDDDDGGGGYLHMIDSRFDSPCRNLKNGLQRDPN